MPDSAAFLAVPTTRLLASAGPAGVARAQEFFAARLRSANTRQAYARAVIAFCRWADAQGLTLGTLDPVALAAYRDALTARTSAPTAKQHLSALRGLFDWLVLGQVLRTNPLTGVRGPRHVVTRGLTPILEAKEARAVLSAIDLTTVVGLRDRALIAVLLYTFSRVSAAVQLRVSDYRIQKKRGWIRLHEKGGRVHEVPAHHQLVEYLDEYLEAAKLGPEAWLFPTAAAGRSGQLTYKPMGRRAALRLVKRRAAAAGVRTDIGCHSFRGTGITTYLSNGGTLEKAQQIAAHASPKTTKLYDRRDDALTLEEIERISI